MRYGKLHHFLILFIILGISGCATTNQAPFPVQQYSDLTSRFNAYFNAKEKMKVVLQGPQKGYKDDYKEVIPVYFYSDKTACASFKGDLEDIEKRCEKSIQIHKYSNFVDDHFLMIARANFLKGDYDKSRQNLLFVTTEYKDGVDYVKEVKRPSSCLKADKCASSPLRQITILMNMNWLLRRGHINTINPLGAAPIHCPPHPCVVIR